MVKRKHSINQYLSGSPSMFTFFVWVQGQTLLAGYGIFEYIYFFFYRTIMGSGPPTFGRKGPLSKMVTTTSPWNPFLRPRAPAVLPM